MNDAASAAPAPAPWRAQAARVVEELFPATPPETWNDLLDLRAHLLAGQDWNAALDLFLRCRERLEAGHYLPFYRLRRLLTASLRLEAGEETAAPLRPLAELLNRHPASLADLKRAVRREIFEHALELPRNARVPLHVVERL